MAVKKIGSRSGRNRLGRVERRRECGAGEPERFAVDAAEKITAGQHPVEVVEKGGALLVAVIAQAEDHLAARRAGPGEALDIAGRAAVAEYDIGFVVGELALVEAVEL